MLDGATNAFPLWVLAASSLGFARPSLFQWFAPHVTPALAAIMIAMGLTLTVEDFRKVLQNKQNIALAFLAQYTIMPLMAWTAARVFGLPKELTTGLILVGTSPGGTASNLVALIGRADVALSVLCTTVSTMASVFMTPFLTMALVGSSTSIRAWDLIQSTLNVVLLPIFGGLAINSFYPKQSQQIGQYTPVLSVLLVALICGSISSSAAMAGITIGWHSARLIAAIVSLHLSGFLMGYMVTKATGASNTVARTISIETGMQNSALASVLAQNFPNPSIVALPGALSATCHSLIGSALAAWWRASSSTATSDTRKATN
jgi:bile acid:Na+ symporter, BASS family